MTQPSEQTMMNVRTELGSFPSPVQANFDHAREALSGRLADEKLDVWAQLGLTISKRTVRSWEAGAELFNASPKVATAFASRSIHQLGEDRRSTVHRIPELSGGVLPCQP